MFMSFMHQRFLKQTRLSRVAESQLKTRHVIDHQCEYARHVLEPFTSRLNMCMRLEPAAPSYGATIATR